MIAQGQIVWMGGAYAAGVIVTGFLLSWITPLDSSERMGGSVAQVPWLLGGESQFPAESPGRVDALVAVIAEAERLRPRARARERLKSLAGRWETISPEKAFHAFAKVADVELRREILELVVDRWAVMDAGAVWRAVLEFEDASLRQVLLEHVAAVLAEVDPGVALERLQSAPGRVRPGAIGLVLVHLARQSPENAARQIVSLTEPGARRQASVAVAEALARDDPSLAFRWADSLEDHNLRKDALVQAARVAGERDPRLALEELEVLEDSPDKVQVIGELVDAWGRRDPEVALAWVRENLALNAQGETIGLLAARVAETNGQVAFELVSDLPHGSARKEAFRRVAGTWGSADPAAAAASMESMPQQDRIAAAEGLVESWTRIDPQEAAAYVASMADREDFRPVIGKMSEVWSETDPASAAAWAASLPADIRSVALDQTVLQWGQQDQQDAAHFIATLSDFSEDQDLAYHVVGSWARWDIREAAGWVDRELDDPEVRRNSYHNLAAGWVRVEPEGAGEWTSSLNEGDREAAIEGIARALIWHDPGTAKAWAATLSNQDRGERLIRFIERIHSAP